MATRILSRVHSNLPLWYLLPIGISAIVLFAIGFDNGVIASALGQTAAPGTWLHEFFHDARHAAGFPCH